MTVQTASAVTVTAPGVVGLTSVDHPEALKPDQVRGKTLCSLISPGTELSWNFRGKEFPNYPGYSAVFEVEDMGADVTGIKKGDRLFGQGSHKSIQQMAAADTIKVPEGLDPSQAVIARLLGVSMTTLMTTRARPGDSVLVTGLGPVGYCAASLFAASGYDVYAIEPNAARRAQIPHKGIRALYPTVSEGSDVLKGRVALVVECSGHEQAVLDGCTVLRKGGELVLVGVPWKRKTDLHMHELLHAVFHGYIQVRSGWEWELPMHASDFAPHSIVSGFKLALQWLSEGKIPLDGLIDQVDPADAQKVYDDCEKGTARKIFSVFDWAGWSKRAG